MTITKQTVADKTAAYLHHEITPAQLVDWAERALMDGKFAESDVRGATRLPAFGDGKTLLGDEPAGAC